MAGFRESFGGNLDFAYQSGRGRGRDIAGTLQSGLAGLSSLRGMAAAAKDAQKQLSNLRQRASDLEEIRSRTEPASKAFAELTYRINETNAAIQKVKKNARLMGFDMLEKSLGGVTKKLITFNTTLLGLGFDFLIDSIKRVYDLQEKWARSIGGFNMRLGGLSSGLNAATKAATRWSSVMRGLTNEDIQMGIQMFEEFTMGIGRMSKALDFQRWGLQVARGFNLGGEGAAQLGKVLDSIGNNAGEASTIMGKNLVSAATQADVPINLLAKDILDASTYLARFGKEGTKTFIQGAAYARKFYISMQQLKGAVEGFDMFDDAAKTASRLNTAFGTMVNSMDLMMEDDPAQRLEMIRQQFLAQGKTFDTLKPKQVRYLSETLKLSEEQVAALLDVRNADMSYSDFKAKEAAKEKAEIDAKRNMELMLRKTTQTLFAFGAAFDRITVAIAKAIRPLLEVFGLVKKNDKEWKSFGQVMGSITKTVEEFFESLSTNDKWDSYMRTLANDLVRAGKALKEFVMSGRAAEFVGELADTMKSFYVWVRDLGIKALPYIDKLGQAFLFLAKNVQILGAAWLGMKGLGTLFKPGGGPLGTLAGMVGKGNKGRGGGQLAKAGLQIGGGVALGEMLGGGAASIGGAAGGMIGQFLGPLGATLGPVIGAALGKAFEYFTRDNEMEDSAKRLADAQKEAAVASQRLSFFQDKSAVLLRKSDLERSRGDKAIAQLQKGKQLFEIHDKQALIERVRQLQGFGKNTDLVNKAFERLRVDGKLSKEMLKALGEASADYNTKLSSLREQTQEFIKLQQEKLGFEADEIKTSLMKNRQAAADLELAELKRQRSAIGEVDIFGGDTEASAKKLLKLQEIDGKIRDAQLKKNDIGIAIEKHQSKVLDKQLSLEMKRFQLESMSRDSGFMQFMQKAEAQGLGKLGQNELAKQYLIQNPAFAASLASSMGLDAAGQQKVFFGMASGGIVTRPTRALIGEAGPEAVIPLRSIAKGRMRMPMSQGGEAAQSMVNFAAGGTQKAGGTQIVSTVAEVKLDSQTVGRALVRSIITGR